MLPMLLGLDQAPSQSPKTSAIELVFALLSGRAAEAHAVHAAQALRLWRSSRAPRQPAMGLRPALRLSDLPG